MFEHEKTKTTTKPYINEEWQQKSEAHTKLRQKNPVMLSIASVTQLNFTFMLSMFDLNRNAKYFLWAKLRIMVNTKTMIHNILASI